MVLDDPLIDQQYGQRKFIGVNNDLDNIMQWCFALRLLWLANRVFLLGCSLLFFVIYHNLKFKLIVAFLYLGIY